jgi:hypothetical protein
MSKDNSRWQKVIEDVPKYPRLSRGFRRCHKVSEGVPR